MGASVQQLVSREIQRWQAEQVARAKSSHATLPVANTICLSNQLGSGGHEVAHRVGEKLGIPVYDREIVEHIATNKHVRVQTVETLDQRAVGRIDDYIANLFRDRNFEQSDYMQALVNTVLALWHHGPSVLIGRGAAHIIPREHSLAVRTVAKLDDRIATLQKQEKLSEDIVRRRIARTDSEREAFSHHYFGCGIDEADVYDLVINTSYMPRDLAADLIVDAYRRKFGSG